MSSTSIGERISTEPSRETLSALQRIAKREHRDIETLLDEALREYVARKEGDHPDPEVMAAFEDSLAQYGQLYRKLAE